MLHAAKRDHVRELLGGAGPALHHGPQRVREETLNLSEAACIAWGAAAQPGDGGHLAPAPL